MKEPSADYDADISTLRRSPGSSKTIHFPANTRSQSKGRSMARLLLLLTALAVSGCTPKVYVHPTKGAGDFNRDKYECQQSATQNAYQMGMAGNMFWIAEQMQQCLEMKYGWVEQAKQ